MSSSRRRRCSICHRGFDADPRVGDRQKVCRRDECKKARRQRSQAAWRRAHQGYFIEWRAKRRSALSAAEPIEPPHTPPPLSRLPWGFAQEEFGAPGADFLASLGRVVVGHAKDEIRLQISRIAEKSSEVAEPLAKDERWAHPTESTGKSPQVGALAPKDERSPLPP